MVPCVILIKDGVVDQNILCDNAEHAELVFKHYWKTKDSNYNNYSEDDIDNVLSDGWIECDNGSICLSWAMTEEEIYGDVSH